MSDRDARLQRLRARAAASTDPDERADFAAAIDALEAKQRPAQSIDDSQVGAVIAGDNSGTVVAPLFPPGASGNTVAHTINIIAAGAQASPADYDAALRRYLVYLHAQHALIDLRGVGDTPITTPLADLFVSLTLHEPADEQLHRPGGLRGAMDDADGKGGARRISWAEALGSHSHLVAVGRPGSGKTTLLHYTALRLAEVYGRDDPAALAALGLPRPLVPLLLPLRELRIVPRDQRANDDASAGPRQLLACLTRYYTNLLDEPFPADFFSRLCESGEAILLLDGLDEVASTEEREVVSRVVGETLKRYRSTRIIVTSRVAAYTNRADLDPLVTLRPGSS